MRLTNTKIEEKRSVFGYKYNVIKFQLPKEHINTINDLIEISDSIHPVDNVQVVVEEKVDPRYSAKEEKIFIPLKYNENNNDIFSILKKLLGDKFEEIIILHENGTCC